MSVQGLSIHCPSSVQAIVHFYRNGLFSVPNYLSCVHFYRCVQAASIGMSIGVSKRVSIGVSTSIKAFL